MTLEELIRSKIEWRSDIRVLIAENRNEPIYYLEARIMSEVKDRIKFIDTELKALGFFNDNSPDVKELKDAIL